ncbi:MAG: 4a-hydroxytetrahydrobiopterin dehydratase [bacterium]|nr:4a-hydroxytetrahydrobiopterin dehydratase [bacterium]
MEKLTEKKCVPCEGGVKPFTNKEIREYLLQLKKGWDVMNGKKIKKNFKFENFKEAVEFLNKVAKIAEQEGHHPDMRVFGWNKVEIELSTHAIGGLSENDFILAAKIEQLQ